MNMTQIIIDETIKILKNKGYSDIELSLTSTFLGDLPMDSLDLATLIVSLEIITGLDPFKAGFKTFHNVELLISLYENVA